MALREELEKQGNWLFKRRSYLPLLMIGLFLLALRDFYYPENRHMLDRVWEITCFVLSFSGIIIRAIVVGSVPRGTSGRNTEEQRAEHLNTTGIYSAVRHPLYLGNFIIWVGVIIAVRSWWFMAITFLIYWLYYERIAYAEEEFLRRKFGQAYEAWAAKTPAFIPSFKHWTSPSLRFSLRNAIRREFSGAFAVVSVFAALDIVQESFVEHKLLIDPMWLTLFVLGLILYLICVVVKKYTNLLVVGPR